MLHLKTQHCSVCVSYSLVKVHKSVLEELATHIQQLPCSLSSVHLISVFCLEYSKVHYLECGEKAL